MVEILEVLSNALAALVGGLFAILGGMIVQRQSVSRQNREYRIKLIENIYGLSIETEEWAQQETIKMKQYISNRNKLEINSHRSKSAHIRMLLKLHFDGSKELCDELDKYEILFFNGMQLAYSAPDEFNKPESQETIMDASKLYFVALVKIREYLEGEMKKLTSIS